MLPAASKHTLLQPPQALCSTMAIGEASQHDSAMSGHVALRATKDFDILPDGDDAGRASKCTEVFFTGSASSPSVSLKLLGKLLGESPLERTSTARFIMVLTTAQQPPRGFNRCK
mmetsp:Transcript_20262/g.36153  ORF Transcript_20262/g.36153 Transcript_20262/m.36153 type:complete len:115 (+) Transcript_20262:877-1221(+)